MKNRHRVSRVVSVANYGPGSGHQTYFAATAITTSVTITNTAICTQKLLAKPLLLKV